MTKRALFLILMGMLCASVAMAGKKNSQGIFTLNGTLAGANIYNANLTLEGGGSGYMDFWLQPAPLEDGSLGYYAEIDWYDGVSWGEIYGSVPASVITPSKTLWGPIQVNITYASFINPEGSYPANFSSLTGTFTPYTGSGSEKMTENGNQIQTTKLSDGTTQLEYSFKGMQTDQSAAFDGTFATNEGSFTVAVDGPSQGADMFVQVGTMSMGPDYY